MLGRVLRCAWQDAIRRKFASCGEIASIAWVSVPNFALWGGVYPDVTLTWIIA